MASAPAATAGLLCVGEPRAAAIGECRLCERFFCGACATRWLERVPVGKRGLWAWRLGCPRCGLSLGEEEGRAVLHSSRTGVVAGLGGTRGASLVGAAPDAVQAAWRQHHRRGLRELAVFHAAASRPEMIAAVDRTLSEACGEPLAWLYKAALCLEADYPHAARAAAGGLQRCAPEDPLMAALLSPAMALGRLDRTAMMRQDLDRYAVALADRNAAQFNPRLTEFDGRVGAYRRGEIAFGEHVRELFAGQTQTAPVIRDYLEALRLEHTVDFPAVQQERGGLLQVLTERLSEEEVQQLLARTLAQRVGAVSVTDYYGGFRKLIDAHQIDLAPFPRMTEYLRYVELTGATDGQELHRQVWDAEQTGYAARCETPQERALVFESARVHLAYRLLDHRDRKLGPGQLAANVAPDPGALERLQSAVEKDAKRRPVGLLARIGSFFKKLCRRLLGGGKTP